MFSVQFARLSHNIAWPWANTLFFSIDHFTKDMAKIVWLNKLLAPNLRMKITDHEKHDGTCSGAIWAFIYSFERKTNWKSGKKRENYSENRGQLHQVMHFHAFMTPNAVENCMKYVRSYAKDDLFHRSAYIGAPREKNRQKMTTNSYHICFLSGFCASDVPLLLQYYVPFRIYIKTFRWKIVKCWMSSRCFACFW